MKPAAVEVEDRADTGARGAVLATLGDALPRFRDAGAGLRRPVRAVVEPLGQPAFLETQVDRHVLHLAPGAARAPWLEGVVARELAHAALADLGHVSHDPALLQASFAAARARSRDLRYLGLVGALNHHVRDVYADDLAARVAPQAVEGFLRHLAELAAGAPGPAERAVEAGYAAGTLLRRGLPAPPALAAVLAASPEARRLADGFGALHPEPEAADLERALLRLVALVPAEA